MNAILDMLPSDTVVLREGGFTTIKTQDVVPGDIVRLSAGDKVPADMRLLSTSGNVRFNRSAMTGESEAVESSLETTDDNFLETHNNALMGTLVANGSVTGVVVFTGAKTVMLLPRTMCEVCNRPSAAEPLEASVLPSSLL